MDADGVVVRDARNVCARPIPVHAPHLVFVVCEGVQALLFHRVPHLERLVARPEGCSGTVKKRGVSLECVCVGGRRSLSFVLSSSQPSHPDAKR